MNQGFIGYTANIAHHTLIKAKMEQIGARQDKLAENIGEDQTALDIYQIYIQVMETEKIKYDVVELGHQKSFL